MTKKHNHNQGIFGKRTELYFAFLCGLFLIIGYSFYKFTNWSNYINIAYILPDMKFMSIVFFIFYIYFFFILSLVLEVNTAEILI